MKPPRRSAVLEAAIVMIVCSMVLASILALAVERVVALA